MTFRLMTSATQYPHPRIAASPDPRIVGFWLAVWAVICFAIVLVGGATRLTESGLSITEW
jgi:cytochrome c oxidase assembly protein subunit 15